MFDLSWTEILVIMVVALIFIGPKDLPDALRTIGKWTAKARGMAQEFRNHVDDVIRESELNKVREEVEKIQNVDIGREIEKTVDPKGEIGKALATPDFSVDQPAKPAEPALSQATSDAAPATDPIPIAPTPAPVASISGVHSTPPTAANEPAPAPAKTATS